MDIFPEVDFFSFLSEEHNHLLSNITVKQQNHIQGLLQQLLALQEETSPESDALRKMLLATLLLELKDLCRQQQEQGGPSARAEQRFLAFHLRPSSWGSWASSSCQNGPLQLHKAGRKFHIHHPPGTGKVNGILPHHAPWPGAHEDHPVCQG